MVGKAPKFLGRLKDVEQREKKEEERRISEARGLGCSFGSRRSWEEIRRASPAL